MKSLLNELMYYINDYWNDIQDPRTRDYPLVNVSPLAMANIMCAYYILVKKIGPEFMKNRQPFQIRSLMFIYNVTMVLTNFYFFIQIASRCNYGRRFLDWKYPDRNDVSPEALQEISIGYWYWLTKFADWIDTIFYVLRKKQSHVSFLHLYHHISVPAFGYIFLKINCLLPAIGLFGLINSFIHTVMYSYYALSALGSKIEKYLWWKRYITIMQLGQFLIGIIYGTFVLFLQQDYPLILLLTGFSQPILFFYLFYNFYQQTYEQHKGKVLIDNNADKTK